MKHAALTALSLVFALILALSPVIAEDAKTTRGEAGDALTPLAMGNTWVYQGDSDTIITTERVEGVVLFDKQPWHLLRSYEREQEEPAEKNIDLGTDLWLAMIDGYECDAFIEPNAPDDAFTGLKLGPASKYFRYPVTLGETYRPNQDDRAIAITITALHEKVTTKAGAFDCVVYRETIADDPGYTLTHYVAPGVGIVKTVTVEGDETYTSSLISYTFAKDE
jgi:hypothetical protein